MEGISPFQSGRPLLSEITADKLNRILSEIKRNRPVVSAPLAARVTGEGTHISLLKMPTPGGGGGTPLVRQPWDLVVRTDPSSNPENPTYLVKVRPGTVSEFLPTNWDEEFALQGNQDYYAIAEVTTDGRAITEVEIKFETSFPAPQEPQLFAVPTIVKSVFGIFTNGVAFRTIGAGNIVLEPKIWFQEARTNVAPGESLYNLYYVLAP